MASVNELAYTKMLLHAQQYPHCAVDGFCLGVRRGDGVEISDVAPGFHNCLLYTSPSPRDATLSRMPSSA